MSDPLDRLVPQNYKASCPQCGHPILEEVMTDVVQSTTFKEMIITADEIGKVYLCEIDALNTSAERGEISHYQCYKCRYVIPGIHDGYALADWILNQNKRN